MLGFGACPLSTCTVTLEVGVRSIQLECQCGHGEMQCFCARFQVSWDRDSSASPSADPASVPALLTARRAACVVHCSPLPEGAAVSATVLGAHAVSPLVFQCFPSGLQHRHSASARRRSPHPHLRREQGTAALQAWGTLECRGAPRPPGMARGARIRPRDLNSPLVFKRF